MLSLQARTTVTPHLIAGRPFPVDTASLQVAEESLHGVIRVQVDRQSVQARAEIQAVLGLELPRPERCTQNGGTRLAWVGPNEWLVFCSVEDENAHLHALTDSLQGQFATMTLMSDSRVSFKVCGSASADFLAKGCAIDLGAGMFPVSAVVTTRFAGLPAMLLHRDTSEYVLYFDVSLADFLVNWTIDAAEEFAA
jgi:sarcosine oxidase subunit gamma